MKKRIKYLDELRIFAILNIILLHVIGLFFYKYYEVSTPKYGLMAFLSSFTRVGIPLFFMLTGALMLTKKEEEDYESYLKKRVMRLVKAYIFFSLIYYGYKVIVYGITINLFELVREITSFNVEYHLWFMPVIILIYIFIPFIKKFVQSLEKEELKRCIFMIWIFSNGFIGMEAISAVFGYSLMSSFILPNLVGYTNYLLVGYYLVNSNYKINKRLIILTILSILCIPFVTIFVSSNELNDVFLNSLSPLVIAPSIFTFLFFKNKKIQLKKLESWISKNANRVFYVYLIHILFISIIDRHYHEIIDKSGLLKDIGLMLLLWIIVSIASFVFAFFWTKLKEIIEKHKEIIKNICIYLLLIGLSIVWILVIGNIIINPYHFIKINYFCTIIGILVWIGIYQLLYRYQNHLFKNKIVNVILIFLYILFQIIIGYCFMVKPTWDFGEVYNIAVQFAKTKSPIFGAPYLYICDNNIMITVLLDIFFKIFYCIGIKNHFIELGILLNIIMIDLSIIYTYKLINKINNNLSKIFLCFLLFSSPLIFYIPIFYTDTLSLPFMVISLYYIYEYIYEKPKIRNIIIAGILIGIGGMIKPTVLIFGIAVIIFLLIRNQKIDYYKFLSIFIVTMIIPLFGQKVFISKFFDKSYLELYKIPKIHYVLIGLENNGEYNEQRYKEINQETGQANKEKKAKESIKKRIKEMITKKEVISFYHRKFSYTWSDGSFYSSVKLEREPIHPFYTKFVYSNKNDDILYWTISNSEWIMVIVLMFLGIIFRKYLPEKIQDISILINISIVGIIIFLLIWETRSRYLVNYIPFFMINAFIGLYALNNYLNQRKREKREKK